MIDKVSVLSVLQINYYEPHLFDQKNRTIRNEENRNDKENRKDC